jgi:hypothetical protein
MRNINIIILFLILFLFLVPNIYSDTSGTIVSFIIPKNPEQGHIDIPYYKIDCGELNEGMGKVFEYYKCSFDFSLITEINPFEGCRFLVVDELTKKVFLNESFEKILVTKDYKRGFGEGYFGEGRYGVSDYYNHTIYQEIPLIFEEEGSHTLVFSFSDCANESFNSRIAVKTYDIFPSAISYIYNKIIEKLDSQNNFNLIMLILAILGLIPLISFLRHKKSKVKPNKDLENIKEISNGKLKN